MEAERKAGVTGGLGKKVKTAAGLFWADYANLEAQVRELAEAGVDWTRDEGWQGLPVLLKQA